MKMRSTQVLTLMLFSIGFMAAGITFTDFFKIMELSWNLNGSNPDKAVWEIIIRSIGAIGTFILAVLFFLLFRNAKNKKILEKQNVEYLKWFGAITSSIGLICIALINALLPFHTVETARFFLLVIIGCAFLFFASIFEIAIKLKEDQELTI